MTPITDLQTANHQYNTSQMEFTTFTFFPKFPVEIRAMIWEWAGGDVLFKPQVYRFALAKQTIRVQNKPNGREKDEDFILPRPSPDVGATTHQFRVISSTCHEARESLILRLPDTFALDNGVFRCHISRDIFLLDSGIHYIDALNDEMTTSGCTFPAFRHPDLPSGADQPNFWNTVQNIAVHEPSFFCFENPLDAFRTTVFTKLHHLYGYTTSFTLESGTMLDNLKCVRFQCDLSTAWSTYHNGCAAEGWFTWGEPWTIATVFIAMAYLRQCASTSADRIREFSELATKPAVRDGFAALANDFLAYMNKYDGIEVGILTGIAGMDIELALVSEMSSSRSKSLSRPWA
jgi:hypothetical protein